MSFWIVIFIIVLLAWANTANRSRPSKPKRARPMKTPPRLKQPESAEHALEIDWPGTFEMIEQAVHQRNYDAARLWLQKFAYTVVSPEVPQSVRDRFKTLMAAFAREDPMYQAVLAKVLPLVAAEPGILQTELYPQLPDYDEEQVRYVLYFAHELGDLKRLKKGRSYRVFGPLQSVECDEARTASVPIDAHHGIQRNYELKEEMVAGKIEYGPVTLSYDVVVNKHPIDEQIAALHREATKHKGNDWNAAVTCLKQAAGLMRKRKGAYTIDRWLRLPVFLQQAGRFAESVKEFERLINETPERIKHDSLPDTSATRIEYRTNLDLKHIYDKMRMVYKREKRLSESAQYAAMSADHDKLANELRQVLEAEREQDRLEYEAKWAKRRERRLR